MTNFESTSYHVEDKAGESVAFTVLPPTADQETAGTGEHDPVLRLWSTQTMPDNRLINVEVGFSVGDVAGLQSFLNDQFGRGKATASSPTPQTQRDNENIVFFNNGWVSALKEVVLLARNERNPIDWAVAQLEGQVVGDEWPTTPGVPAQPDYTPGPEAYAEQRQCPVISNGVQCNRPEGHGNTNGLTHYFSGQSLQQAGQPMTAQTGDGAATPPATAPSATPVPAGGEQAAESATGVGAPAAAPSSAPAEKKRTRRTKLEMAYDRAQESGDQQAIFDATAALEAKDPGNERLHQVATIADPVAGRDYMSDSSPTPGAASPNPNPVQIVPVPNPQPVVQFAGEPVNPFTQPAPDPQSYGAPFPGNVPAIPATGQLAGAQSVQVSPAESQAAQGFPCPQMDSSGTRQCVRPYGHELMTATNPEPKPHVFATDPGALGGPLQPVQQAPQADPVEAFIPMPAQPQQPAFSVTTPALTGMTDGGAQILSFQTPPMPADPTAFQVQGANLQPPAPAAPFLQPVPNGGS